MRKRFAILVCVGSAVCSLCRPRHPHDVVPCVMSALIILTYGVLVDERGFSDGRMLSVLFPHRFAFADPPVDACRTSMWPGKRTRMRLTPWRKARATGAAEGRGICREST